MFNSQNKKINEQIVERMEAGEPIGMNLSTGDIDLREGNLVSSSGELDNARVNTLRAKPGTKVAANGGEDFGQTSISVNEHGEFVEEGGSEVNNDQVLVAKAGTKVAAQPRTL